MKLLAIALLFLIGTAVPVLADHPCDPYAPYYTKIETGPGSLLADLFLFTFSAPVAVGTVGGRRATVCDRMTGQCRRVSTAACLPITTARHFVGNRPPHPEHWVAED